MVLIFFRKIECSRERERERMVQKEREREREREREGGLQRVRRNVEMGVS